MPDTSILVFGDYHIYGAYNDYMRQNPEHEVFGTNLRHLISSSDFRIFNLEDPVTESNDGVLKYGPYGKGSSATLKPLQKAGFNLATFATNHTWDFQQQGLQDTLQHCEKAGLQVIGTGFTQEEARRTEVIEVGAHRVAFINCARNEFSAANGFHGGANPLDIVQNAKAVQLARQSADFVIVIIHAGVDLCSYPSPQMVEHARFLVDQGASAVLYHHARVVSGWEIYQGAPIFYGLGNLLHLTKNRTFNDEHVGLGIRLLLSSSGIGFEVHPIRFEVGNVQVELMEGEEKASLLARLERLNDLIANPDTLKEAWGAWVEERFSALYLAQLAGLPMFSYRVMKKLKLLPILRKHLLKRQKRILPLWNIARCETHFEALDYILNKAYYSKKQP